MATYYVVDEKGNIAALSTSSASADLSNLNASNLTSGTVPLARLSGITNTEIDAAAAIAWSKLSKAGSSLADLATRSAADLSSGALPVARLSNGVITVVTSTSTGTQNDFAPGLSGNTTVRLNNATDLTITGIAAGVAGQRVTLVSVGAGNVYLKHADTGSTAANRFSNLVTSGDTPLAAGKGSATYEYDATSSVWRLVQHEMGAFLSVPYASGNFTGSGSMTWTVDSGDVGTQFKYFIHGKVMEVIFYIETTSVGGTPSTQLKIKIPGGYTTASGAPAQAVGRMSDNAAPSSAVAGVLLVLGADTFVYCFKDLTGASNWSASTNNTYVYGEMFIALT